MYYKTRHKYIIINLFVNVIMNDENVNYHIVIIISNFLVLNIRVLEYIEFNIDLKYNKVFETKRLIDYQDIQY